MVGDRVTRVGVDGARVYLHPARARALTLLADGSELTATQLGERIGLSPSAMSWHLRLLAEHGFVEHAASTDGRERPWRARVSDVRLSEAAWDPALLGEIGTMVGASLAGAFTEAERFASDPEVVSVEMASRWYTRAEMAVLRQRIRELAAAFGSDERRDDDEVRCLTVEVAIQIDAAPPPPRSQGR